MKAIKFGKISFFIVLSMIVLICLNVVQNSNSVLLLAIGLFLFTQLLFSKKLTISKEFILIFAFSISSLALTLLNFKFDISLIYRYTVVPFLGYFLANYLILYPANTNRNEPNLHKFKLFIYSVVLGIFLYCLLVLIVNYLNFGTSAYNRWILEPWSLFTNGFPSRFGTATYMSAFLLPLFSFGITFLINYKSSSPLLRTFSILLTLLAIVSSAYFQNRAFFVVGFLVLLFLLWIIFKSTKFYEPFLITICILFFIGFILLILARINLFGINGILSNIPVLNRFVSGGSNSERLAIYIEFFSKFFLYPFGGLSKVATYNYVHNVALDIYSDLGIIPSLIFAYLNIDCLINIVIYKEKFKPFGFLLISLFFSFFCLSLFEPLMNSNNFIGVLYYTFLFSLKRYITWKNANKFASIDDLKNKKVILINHFLTNHIYGFHKELSNYFGSNYSFVCFDKPNDDHQKYDDTIQNDKNVCRIDIKNKNKLKRIISDADIIIYSNCPRKLLYKIYKKRKVIIQISERPYSNHIFERYRLKSLYNQFIYALFFEKFKPICLGCSTYTAFDYSSFDHCLRRTFRWNYFYQDKGFIPKKPEEKIKIGFVNRFVDWKRPFEILNLSKYLKSKGYNFISYMVGFGDSETEKSITDFIKTNDLSENVNLLGMMKNDAVHDFLNSCDVCISTSNIKERCGCAISESLLCSTCVVSSVYTGSGPELIDNNKNGILYNINNFDSLKIIFDNLFGNKKNILEIKNNAYDSFNKYYNAKNAFKYFIDLLQGTYNCSSLKYPCGLLNNNTEIEVLSSINNVKYNSFSEKMFSFFYLMDISFEESDIISRDFIELNI